MAQLQIISGERRQPLAVQPGTTILDALRAAGVRLTAPCGGTHHCGKCRVQASGALSPVSAEEAALLAGDTERLACFAHILGDSSVTLPPSAVWQVLTAFHRPLHVPAQSNSNWGIACDIGTTTVAAYLLRGGYAEPVASVGEYNAQACFGADVLSRIAYTMEHGPTQMQRTITGQLESLSLWLCRQADIRPGEVRSAVVTGNTTMLHLLCGLDAGPLALAPFTPASLFGMWTRLPLGAFASLPVYLPPCVSAYVGADVVCGALATQLEAMPGTVLFLDVGTNGEMILKTDTQLLACATAAGPAFEGAGISCGSGAVPGAISHVWLEDGRLRYETIADRPPESICGSGLIDAAAALIQVGLLNRKGRLRATLGGSCMIGQSGVCLTQKDIRELQLAKAAVRAGIQTLLDAAELLPEQLDQVVLAGGFGMALPVASAAAIGLLPGVCAGRVVAAGNTAGAGAAQLLLDEAQTAQAASLAGRIRYLELAGNPQFAKHFIKYLSLEP